MAKLHSASPREITLPFTREIISELHSKACNNLYRLHADPCNKSYISREISNEDPIPIFILLWGPPSPFIWGPPGPYNNNGDPIPIFLLTDSFVIIIEQIYILLTF